MPNFKLGSAVIIALCISAALIVGCQSNINSMLSFMQADKANSEIQANEGKILSPLKRYNIEYKQNEPVIEAKYLLDYGDEEKGLEQLKSLAEQGDSYAICALWIYYTEKGNAKLSEEWREKAIEARDFFALLDNFTTARETGDERLIARTTLELAIAGQTISQLATGANYLKGSGLPINYEKGLYWIHKVADLNMDLYICEESEVSDIRKHICLASTLLAEIYQGLQLNGQYFDNEKYIKYLERAAEFGSVSKQYEAALIYAYLEGYQNLELANKYFQYVLDQKNESDEIYGKAAFIYADFLSENYGEQRNQDVVKYLTIASSKGFLDKYPDIGDFYFSKKDYLKAKDNYEKALKKDKTSKARGLYGLGTIYCEGLGVPKDYRKALNYLNQAFQLKQEGAAFLLGKMYFIGLGVEADTAKAIKYFSAACSMGDSQGCEILKKLSSIR